MKRICLTTTACVSLLLCLACFVRWAADGSLFEQAAVVYRPDIGFSCHWAYPGLSGLSPDRTRWWVAKYWGHPYLGVLWKVTDGSRTGWYCFVILWELLAMTAVPPILWMWAMKTKHL